MLPFIVKKTRSDIKNDYKNLESNLRNYFSKKLDSSEYVNNNFLNVLNSSKLESLEFIEKYFKTIFAWINSNEFYEKYEVKAHPYPSFLNPDVLNYKIENKLDSIKNENLEQAYKEYEKENLTYELISANVAWDLNIPLPRNYEFVRSSLGSSAGAAFISFIKECQVIEFNFWDCNTYHTQYEMLNKYSKGQQKTSIINSKAEPKYMFMIDKKCPYVFISRDPIGKLKSVLNHIDDKKVEASFKPIMSFFNMTFEFKHLMPKVYYRYNESKEVPNVENIKNPVSTIGQFKECIKSIEIRKDNISQLICLDFNKLKYDYAFETITNLAKTINLPLPQDEQKFRARIYHKDGALSALPSRLYSHTYDLNNKKINDKTSLKMKGGFEIFIGLYIHFAQLKDTYKDISNEILEQEIIINEARIFVYIKSADFDKFKNNQQLFNKSKEYIKNYVKVLENQTKEIKENLIKEQDILEYLKNNKTLAMKIKNDLKDEINFIKTNYPQVMESWTYYKEFERICTQLGA